MPEQPVQRYFESIFRTRVSGNFVLLQNANSNCSKTRIHFAAKYYYRFAAKQSCKLQQNEKAFCSKMKIPVRIIRKPRSREIIAR